MDYVKESIRGGQFDRYLCPASTDEFVLYITDDFDRRKGRRLFQYLSQNKRILVDRSVEKRQGKRKWYVLFRSRYSELFNRPKIIIRQTGDRIVAAIDDHKGYFCIDSVNVVKVKPEYNSYLDYFLGLLNSRLMTFFYQEISQERGRVLAQVKPQRIRFLPISIESGPRKKQIEQNVRKIRTLMQREGHFEDKSKKDKCLVLQQEIDQVVYELYGLTEEEIRIVEGEK